MTHKALSKAVYIFVAIHQQNIEETQLPRLVFIRPPGISHRAFELRINNAWFSIVYSSLKSSQNQMLVSKLGGTNVLSSLAWSNTEEKSGSVLYLLYFL
jgi:hypothetical protein